MKRFITAKISLLFFFHEKKSIDNS